jgi:hypothetical protein
MFNESYLQLVRAQYWHQIETGLLPGVRDAEVLLLSVTLAQSALATTAGTTDLPDFDILCTLVEQGPNNRKKEREQREAIKPMFPGLHRFLESMVFNSLMMLCIVASAAVTQLEDNISGNEDVFFVFELVFLSVFCLEFLLKFADEQLRYFKGVGNCFDVILIIMGVCGVVLTNMVEADVDSGDSAMTAEESSDLGSKGRLLRIARVFRVLRLVRVVRLYRLYMAVRAVFKHQNLSLELADHLHFIAVLTGFVRAHVGAQKALVKFFCREEEVHAVEVARNILQSQIGCYQAITKAVQAEQALDKKAMRGVMALRESMDVMYELENFVLECHKAGILDGRDTESILHPMHLHMKQFCKTISLAYEGITGEWDDIRDFTKHAEDDNHGGKGPRRRAALTSSGIMAGVNKLTGRNQSISSGNLCSDSGNVGDDRRGSSSNTVMSMLRRESHGGRRNSSQDNHIHHINRPLAPLSDREFAKVEPYARKMLNGFRQRHPEFKEKKLAVKDMGQVQSCSSDDFGSFSPIVPGVNVINDTPERDTPPPEVDPAAVPALPSLMESQEQPPREESSQEPPPAALPNLPTLELQQAGPAGEGCAPEERRGSLLE